MSDVQKPKLWDKMSKQLKLKWWKAHGKGQPFPGEMSVKGVDTYKKSERLKRLEKQSKSGAGYDLNDPESSGRDTIVPLTADQRAKIAEVDKQKRAAEKAAKAAEKKKRKAERITTPRKPSIKSKEDRLSFIKAAFSKAKSPARQAKFDVPTVNPDDEGHDDLRDLHQSLHVRRGYNEEFEQVDEVTKQEAEKVLGGTVKERPKMPPGKQDPKHRYVRNLARKAMRAGLKNEATSFPRGGGVINYNPKTEKSEKDGTAKLYDPETERMQKKLAAGKMSPSQVMKKMKEEVEQVNEMDKSQPSSSRGAEGLATGTKATPVTFKKTAADALKLLKKKVKSVKEEVEQVFEQDDTMEKKEMAQTQLHFIGYAAKEILEFIDMGGEIEEWYQNKLSKVQSEVESLHSYIEGEKRRTGMVKEEIEVVDEKINLVKAKMGDVIKDFKKSDAPQFKGKSMEKRRQMAVAAKLGAEREAGMREEVEQVTEAEGTVAATPKEKALAAHHGDPKKITYGDVIKARLKSAAAKKMGK